MDNPLLEKVAASRARLRIADLLSTRPRPLGELARSTRISVQAVLKHLSILGKLGLVEELTLTKPRRLGVRKLYAARKALVGDYSRGDLMVVKITQALRGESIPAQGRYRRLARLAEDSIIQRGRVRDQARRLDRMIQELARTQSGLMAEIENLSLTDEDKLVAYVAFTEDSEEDASRVLSSFYGCREPLAAIEEVNSKLRAGD